MLCREACWGLMFPLKWTYPKPTGPGTFICGTCIWEDNGSSRLVVGSGHIYFRRQPSTIQLPSTIVGQNQSRDSQCKICNCFTNQLINKSRDNQYNQAIYQTVNRSQQPTNSPNQLTNTDQLTKLTHQHKSNHSPTSTRYPATRVQDLSYPDAPIYVVKAL